MPVLFASKEYARSQIGEALLDACQFAHVPEADIWAYLDAAENARRVVVRCDDGKKDVAVEVNAYFAPGVLGGMTKKHGVLCPVCLCPVHQVQAGNYFYLDGALVLHRDDRGSLFQAHGPCSVLATAIEWIESPRETDIERGLWMLGKKRRFHDVAEVVRQYAKPLRFNPRRPTVPQWKQYGVLNNYDSSFEETDILRAA